MERRESIDRHSSASCHKALKGDLGPAPLLEFSRSRGSRSSATGCSSGLARTALIISPALNPVASGPGTATELGASQRQADAANLLIQRLFQQCLGRSFLVDPFNCRLDFLVIHQFGFQFSPEAMRSEGPVLSERIRVLLGEFAIVEVTQFSQAAMAASTCSVLGHFFSSARRSSAME